MYQDAQLQGVQLALDPLRAHREAQRLKPPTQLLQAAEGHVADRNVCADAPDKMRRVPQRTNAKGQTKRLFKRRCRAHKPKDFKAQYPGPLHRPRYNCALSARDAPHRLNGHRCLYPNGNSSGNQPL